MMFSERKTVFPEINEAKIILDRIFKHADVTIQNNTLIIESDSYNEPGLSLFALKEKKAIECTVKNIASEVDRFIIHKVDIEKLKQFENGGLPIHKTRACKKSELRPR